MGAFWTATQSQIYRELHDLLERRLVTVEVMPQDGKPPRKVYSLTVAGREALRRWLDAPMEPAQLRDPLLLRMVFAADLPPAQLDAALADYEDGLRVRQKEYRARMDDEAIFGLARSDRERLIWTLSIEGGLAWCGSQLAWAHNARSRLAAVPARGVRAARPRRRTRATR